MIVIFIRTYSYVIFIALLIMKNVSDLVNQLEKANWSDGLIAFTPR